MGTQIHFQINSTIRPGPKALTNNWMLKNKKAKNANDKLRSWEDKTAWFERFMKLLEIKVHYQEIEAFHLSSWFRKNYEISRTLQ